MKDIGIIDTTIYIGDFAIHQPVTVLTDYIITVLCFCFFLQLNRPSFKDETTINWKRFFLILGFASFFGGSSHGFFSVHEGLGYKLFWLPMQALNVFAVYQAQKATLYSALKDSGNKYYWNLSYHIQLILFFVSVFLFQNFVVVIINSVIGLIPIMIIHFIDSKKAKASSWIAYGIAVLFLTAFVNASKFSIHAYFNYMDFAHILIMINLSLMFIGIKKKAISSILTN
ncbi:MAG: hypothetical protein K8R85_10850 [Bacteroidetes bacterium]|nr:hypothetical protein [Bacteroidota bacterium]